MAPDDHTTASLAARLRAEIRAELEAGLAIPAPVVAPVQMAATGAVPLTRIPATPGRPELVLPEGASLSTLPLPASVKAGATVSYSAADSARGGGLGGGAVAGVGYTNAHITFASGTVVSMDIRRYVRPDPRLASALSIGCLAVIGDVASAGIYWIHPTLLDLVSGARAVKQADGVTVERVPLTVEGATFNAVRIAQTSKAGQARTLYDRDTGFLLSQEQTVSEGLNSGQLLQTYLSRRELKIPWAGQPVPDWVAQTRRLTFRGANTIVLAGTNLVQPTTLSADLEPVTAGVVLAKATVVTDSGFGYPGAQSSWEMACASAMLYPLWIAPAALRQLTPHQVIDQDPVTGFTITATGVEGDYVTIVEEGRHEMTTYFFDLRDGRFSGFRSQRPFGDGGGRMHTELWIEGPS